MIKMIYIKAILVFQFLISTVRAKWLLIIPTMHPDNGYFNSFP